MNVRMRKEAAVRSSYCSIGWRSCRISRSPGSSKQTDHLRLFHDSEERNLPPRFGLSLRSPNQLQKPPLNVPTRNYESQDYLNTVAAPRRGRIGARSRCNQPRPSAVDPVAPSGLHGFRLWWAAPAPGVWLWRGQSPDPILLHRLLLGPGDMKCLDSVHLSAP